MAKEKLKLCDKLDCDTCLVEDCEILELTALKKDFADCEKEYRRVVQQYNSVVEQNKQLQSIINKGNKNEI